MINRICATALAATAMALATPAFAGITPVSNCSFSDVTGAGISVTDCSGYYVGNLNNNADFANVKALLATEFPGAAIGSKIVEQVNVNSGSGFNFAQAVWGDTVIGVHWGGGKGGGNTAFYRVDIGNGFTGFDIASTNPARDSGGISNVALYSTTPVPEPSAYALMFAGLAALGFVARRRKPH